MKITAAAVLDRSVLPEQKRGEMSFLSTITEFHKTYKESIQKVFVGIATAIFLCVELHLPWISTNENVREVAESLAIALMLTCAVEIVGTIHSMSRKLSEADSGISFGPQTKLYQKADELLKQLKKPIVVTFYHYSGQMIENQITDILDLGHTIHLFLQAPKTAKGLGSEFQSERIRLRLSALAAEESRRSARLKIHLSEIPHTIRAARFGEEFVILGWYSYGKIEKARPGHPGDLLNVHGHDMHGILIERRHSSFQESLTFLKDYERRLHASEVSERDLRSSLGRD